MKKLNVAIVGYWWAATAHTSSITNFIQKIQSDKTKWSQLSMKMLDSGDVADHPYKLQFDTFFQSITNNTEMPLTGLREAMKTHEIVFAADKSAATGKSVRL